MVAALERGAHLARLFETHRDVEGCDAHVGAQRRDEKVYQKKCKYGAAHPRMI
jgi:hypothetical protein